MFRAALATTALAALVLSGCAPAAAPDGPTQSPAGPGAHSPAPGGTQDTPAAEPTPDPRPSQPEELTIESVSNFRDVAGTGEGLPVADGGRMARGVVFRSGRLKGLSAFDTERLVAAGVTDIFDLRTGEVADRSPDPAIGDATYHLVNVFGVYSQSDPEVTDAEQAILQREEVYRDFVADRGQRARIGGLLQDIAEADGAAIVHCSEGKDRTGWVSAVLQMIAGVDDQTIMEEYLLSNERRAELIEKDVAKVLQDKGKTAAEIKRAQREVYERYLQAGLSEMDDRFGDLQGYLTDGLGLSPATIEELRDRLVLG